MDERFTKKQRDLLNACAADYENMGDGVMVKAMKGLHAMHSSVTASSLAARGWIYVAENGVGEQYASFDDQQYGEWVELNGGVDGE